MRTATPLVLLSILPLSAGSITIVNNCAGNDVCIVDGSVSGFDTTVFSASVTAEGDNSFMGFAPGPGGSGSVTIDEIGKTEGPVRSGFILFSYGITGWDASGGANVGADFSVGGINGMVPGETGAPRPAAGEYLPFTLGVPFEITLDAFFSVPPAAGMPGRPPVYRYASADINFSFSLFEAVSETLVNGSTVTVPGDPVLIADPPSLNPTSIPEPGTSVTVALALAFLAARRAALSR